MPVVAAGADPPVVFVAALGTEGATWRPVIDRLTCGVTTFTYDRPGVGSSPPRTHAERPVPYSVFADELAAVLDDASLRQPVVLVGHSVGSLIVRVFAGRHLDWVTGVVHVDGSIPRLALWCG